MQCVFKCMTNFFLKKGKITFKFEYMSFKLYFFFATCGICVDLEQKHMTELGL